MELKLVHWPDCDVPKCHTRPIIWPEFLPHCDAPFPTFLVSWADESQRQRWSALESISHNKEAKILQHLDINQSTSRRLAWWHTPVMLALKRLKQSGLCKFKVNMGYKASSSQGCVARSCLNTPEPLKKKTQNNSKRVDLKLPSNNSSHVTSVMKFLRVGNRGN